MPRGRAIWSARMFWVASSEAADTEMRAAVPDSGSFRTELSHTTLVVQYQES